jgi:hypothetical protein
MDSLIPTTLFHAMSREQSLRNRIHDFAMVIAREHMPIGVHSHLQGSVAYKGLHGLGREAGLDPARHGEMAEGVPLEPLHRRPLLLELGEQRIELMAKMVAVAHVSPALVREHQIVVLRPRRAQFPRLHQFDHCSAQGQPPLPGAAAIVRTGHAPSARQRVYQSSRRTS